MLPKLRTAEPASQLDEGNVHKQPEIESRVVARIPMLGEIEVGEIEGQTPISHGQFASFMRIVSAKSGQAGLHR